MRTTTKAEQLALDLVAYSPPTTALIREGMCGDLRHWLIADLSLLKFLHWRLERARLAHACGSGASCIRDKLQ